MTARLDLPKRPKTTIPLLDRVASSRQFKSMLWPLEKLTDNRQVRAADTAPVATVDKLTSTLLDDFFSNRVAAIHLPGFVPREACEQLSDNILKQSLINWNVYDPHTNLRPSDVEVLGEPFNMASRSDEAWQRYFRDAMSVPETLRRLSRPFLSPFDQFRAILDEQWRHGVTIARYKGARMSPGLARIMHDKDVKSQTTALGCHIDSPPMLQPRSGLFSVSMYLKPPVKGSQIYIWNPDLSSLYKMFANWSLVKNFFLESSYLNEDLQVRYQKLLPPPLKIDIGVGDALIINTGRPHAVAPFEGGPRVSLQAFMNYRRGRPIELWA